MSDFTAAPYRGDPGIPHAEEASYTVRSRSAALCPQCGGRLVCRWIVQHVHIARCTSVRGDLCSSALSDLWFLSQVFIGGCWVSLGLQYLKDITEFRPMFRRVVHERARCFTAKSVLTSRLVHGSLNSPDHVMVVAEEAYKRRQLKAGKPYTGKLPVRASLCSVAAAVVFVSAHAPGPVQAYPTASADGRNPIGVREARTQAVRCVPKCSRSDTVRSSPAVTYPGRPATREQRQDAAHHQVEDGSAVVMTECYVLSSIGWGVAECPQPPHKASTAPAECHSLRAPRGR